MDKQDPGNSWTCHYRLAPSAVTFPFIVQGPRGNRPGQGVRAIVKTEEDAQLIASAPDLKAKNERLREALTEIMKAWDGCSTAEKAADKSRFIAQKALNGSDWK